MGRYSKYKQSGIEWIGDIPEHWIKTKFKYETTKSVQYGLNTNSEKYVDDGVRFLRTTDIDDYGNICDEGVRISPDEIPNDYLLQRFDFLISRSGTLGRTYLHLSDERYSYAGYLVRFNFGDLIKSKFIFYYSKSKNFLDWIVLNTIQSTIGNVNGEKYSNLEFVSPPLSEQLQIVQFLDERTELIDKLISTKERKIDLLKQQRTSLINEVITKGLNPDVKMKDSGVEWIGEIPEHYSVITLHKLLQTNKLEFQDGNHGGEHPNPEEFEDVGVPFIKPKDIQDGKVEWDTCDKLPIDRCQRFRIGFSFNNDVLLVNRGGSIGKVCFVNDFKEDFPYFVINPQVTYLRGKNGLDSKFVFYITKSDIFRCGVDLILGHGSTFPFLGLSNMGDFQMVLPPIQEQQQIVDYLDTRTKEIDDLVSMEQKKIDLLKEYRQSLISEVITGKINVQSN